MANLKANNDGGRSGKTSKQAPEKAKKKALRRLQRSISGPKIELYQLEDDPYSHAVRTRLSELGIDYVAHCVPENSALKHEQLLHAGGRDQIPFLVDHSTGTKLYDADVILSYLDTEYGRPEESTGVVGVAHAIESRIRARADQLAWAIRTPFERFRILRREATETLAALRRSTQIIVDSLAENQEPSQSSQEEAPRIRRVK